MVLQNEVNNSGILFVSVLGAKAESLLFMSERL
jgi:hypothetical protein